MTSALLRIASRNLRSLHRPSSTTLTKKSSILPAFFSSAPQKSESFLSASSSLYVESMLEQYEADPTSVPESWQVYFQSLDNADSESGVTITDDNYFNQPTIVLSNKKTAVAPAVSSLPSDSLGVAHLIRAYQVNGHRSANLDPLGLHTNESFPFRPGNVRSPTDVDSNMYEALTVKFHGFDPD
eukprot:CAMPEP_0201687196 /NCGR_PEP_ID=MMETSP0578-20130828/1358_1 /ASSEMBLY_ACC=CAM_ASM_000663 /TAXON_ID=267565 /ORGANISM="Skeletonema grethea, Strain CCMP 1804" /LENGTH=183 /DNA_ID=CAMNT_0048171329 /DNA_START=243 /DNA_END=791 /DNA_ORIENTATION=-